MLTKGKYNAPSIAVGMQRFFAKYPLKRSSYYRAVSPFVYGSVPVLPGEAPTKAPIVRVAAERRRRPRSAARAGGALRERKAAAAQSRKGFSAASTTKTVVARKGKAMGGAAATPEQETSGRAAQVPELNGASGYGAATPPISFSDGSCFFDGAGPASSSTAARCFNHGC